MAAPAEESVADAVAVPVPVLDSVAVPVSDVVLVPVPVIVDVPVYVPELERVYDATDAVKSV